MITLVVALSENNCIGKDGSLPWHIPEDLKRFKRLTTDHVVLMGRKTWESLPDRFRPLPNRVNVVITRQPTYPLPSGVEHYSSIEQALTSHSHDDIMIIGGGDIFAQTIDKADRLYITRVHTHVAGDTFFPNIDSRVWNETQREDHNDFSFVTYTRR